MTVAHWPREFYRARKPAPEPGVPLRIEGYYRQPGAGQNGEFCPTGAWQWSQRVFRRWFDGLPVRDWYQAQPGPAEVSAIAIAAQTRAIREARAQRRNPEREAWWIRASNNRGRFYDNHAAPPDPWPDEVANWCLPPMFGGVAIPDRRIEEKILRSITRPLERILD